MTAAILLSAAFNTAGIQPVPDDSPSAGYSAQDIQPLVDVICSSTAPFLIVDTFSRQPDFGNTLPDRIIDLDGDMMNDISHGEFVAMIMGLSGHDLLTYGVGNDGKKNEPPSQENFSAALDDVVAKLESGEIPTLSGVILAWNNPVTLRTLQDMSGIEEEITPENLASLAGRILEGLKENQPEDSHVIRNLRAIETLHQMGIPVIAAAGNDYSSNKVNLYGVYGAILVGAHTADNAEPAPYSNNNSLTAIFRQGDYISREVSGGIDINNDSIADFPETMLSNGPSFVDMYQDMTMDEAIATGSFFHTAADYYGPIISAYRDQPFRVNEEGLIVYDPAANSDPSQVMMNSGTSFSAPAICNTPKIEDS